MSGYITTEDKRRLVKVIGRDEPGEVVHGGHNFGSMGAVYCVGVRFPSNGFCGYYDVNMVTFVEAKS